MRGGVCSGDDVQADCYVFAFFISAVGLLAAGEVEQKSPDREIASIVYYGNFCWRWNVMR